MAIFDCEWHSLTENVSSTCSDCRRIIHCSFPLSLQARCVRIHVDCVIASQQAIAFLTRFRCYQLTGISDFNVQLYCQLTGNCDFAVKRVLPEFQCNTLLPVNKH